MTGASNLAQGEELAIIVAKQVQPERFVPTVGYMLIVTFPGETMRCPVQRVVSENAAIVQIATPPISRMHTFRFEDKVGVRRRRKNGIEFWEAQSDKDFLAEQARLVRVPVRKRPHQRKGKK